jgi:hypothetical protein
MKHIILYTILLFAGCSQTSAPVASVRIRVQPDPANNEDANETLIAFQPPSMAEIVVQTGGQRSTVTFNSKNPNSDKDSILRLSATRRKSDVEGKASFETLIRPETPNGSRAGGPHTQDLSSDTKLTDVLNVTIQDGDYPLGKPIEIGTHRGEPVILTVNKISK